MSRELDQNVDLISTYELCGLNEAVVTGGWGGDFFWKVVVWCDWLVKKKFACWLLSEVNSFVWYSCFFYFWSLTSILFFPFWYSCIKHQGPCPFFWKKKIIYLLSLLVSLLVFFFCDGFLPRKFHRASLRPTHARLNGWHANDLAPAFNGPQRRPVEPGELWDRLELGHKALGYKIQWVWSNFYMV